MRWEAKRPGEVRDYHHDWSAFLDGDTITDSDWTVSGVTKDNESFDSDSVTIWLSGGTAGTTATVTNTITTASGRIETEVFSLLINTLEEPVSLDEAKAHLRVTTNDENDFIINLISAAREWVENYTGFILVQREVTDVFYSWGGHLTLRRQPITVGDPTPAMTVTYIDTDGDAIEYTGYVLRDQAYPWTIYPPSGDDFPELGTNGHITVTYTAGYATAADVPNPLRQCVLLLIAQWHMGRAGISLDDMKEVPFAVTSLCRPYRGVVVA